MSYKKWFIALATAAVSVSCFAEFEYNHSPQRPLFTLDNTFPRWKQVEVGGMYHFEETNDGFTSRDRHEVIPYARYGLLKNLAVTVEAPFVTQDQFDGDSKSGIGDLSVGFQLLAWEDIFRYPFIIPYAEVNLPTGDEDDLIGRGTTTFEFGLNYGNKMYDYVTCILKAGALVDSENGNQLLLAASFIFHIDDDFDLLAEVNYEDENDLAPASVVITGGMSYNWTEQWQMGAHVGGGVSGDTEVIGDVRVSYSF